MTQTSIGNIKKIYVPFFDSCCLKMRGSNDVHFPIKIHKLVDRNVTRITVWWKMATVWKYWYLYPYLLHLKLATSLEIYHWPNTFVYKCTYSICQLTFIACPVLKKVWQGDSVQVTISRQQVNSWPKTRHPSEEGERPKKRRGRHFLDIVMWEAYNLSKLLLSKYIYLHKM